MARRILNRKELRADYESAEHRSQEEDEEVGAESDVGDAEEDSEAEDIEAEGVKSSAKKAAPKGRARAPKMPRVKVVWAVFNNSNQRVAVFEYPKRAEAEALAARLTADKRTTHFVQPVKEPIETAAEK